MIELEGEVRALRQHLTTILCYVDPDELKAIGRIASLTPRSTTLSILASENPPPAEWLEDDD